MITSKVFKKNTALALTLILLFGFIPVKAPAEETDSEPPALWEEATFPLDENAVSTATPAALMLAASVPTGTFDLSAATWSTGSDADHNCSWDSISKTLTVNDGANIEMVGTVNDGTLIEVNGAVSITLNDASITALWNDHNSPLRLHPGADLSLTLLGQNFLEAFGGAGIRVPDGTTLTINGPGELRAKGNTNSSDRSGAGIGGYFNETSGNITINSGTIIAIGADNNAGIGGGWEGNGGIITISGGTVEASSTDGGAGIGGGRNGKGGDITINGSAVVKATGGNMGAGIGGGGDTSVAFGNRGEGGVINISGNASIEATGGNMGAGIGGGLNSGGGIITISGSASVEATGGGNGAGIGNGLNGGDAIININGDVNVTATGGSDGAGIGFGLNGTGGEITISGGTVTATGTSDGAGIGGGGGMSSAGCSILIYGENTIVTATGGAGTQDIGTGSGLTVIPANIFVALPEGNLKKTGGTHIGNTVLFTADQVRGSHVSAALPAALNGVSTLNLFAGLNPTGKPMSVITTYDAQNINFGLSGYSPVTRTGTQLMSGGATVNFSGGIPASQYTVSVTTPNIAHGGTYTFADAAEGYAPIAAASFTISNTGTGAMSNLDVNLSGTDGDRFTLIKTGLNATLASGNTTSFTIKPNDDLAEATYTALVTITDANMVPYTFTVSFIVGPSILPLTFTDSPTYDIPSSTVGTAITNINVSGGVSGGAVPYTFSATGLPAGITIDSGTGIISGIPTTEGAAGTATIRVTDSVSAFQEITINYGAISAAEAGTYPVVYDLNGGTGTTPLETNKTAGTTFTAASGTTGITAPSGFAFEEWNTQSDGLGTGYAAGATITMPGSALTLYAIWEFEMSEDFVPVTDITNVPETTTAGTSLTLTGTVNPATASNKTIVWSVQNPGTTGAEVSGNTLTTKMAGTVTVRATIVDGTAAGTDYIQDFNIAVSAPGDNGNGGGSGNGGSGGGGGGGGPTQSSQSTGSTGRNTQTQPNYQFSNNAIYVKGSGIPLVLTVQRTFSDFRNVAVGGRTLTRDRDYTAASGSTVVTLLPDYLETLDPERHRITVGFSGGGNLRTYFTVEAATTDADAPEYNPPITEQPSVIPGVPPFDDVNASDWFAGAVMWVYEKGLMTGTSIDPMLFSPQSTLTRGMAVTMLYLHGGRPDVASLTNPFDDVEAGKWYRDAVVWAAANGIAAGTGDGKFAPYTPITRQDLAMMFNNYAIVTGMHLPEVRSYTVFADDADIRDYARQAVERFFRADIINGKQGGLFDPLGKATRAEFATMVMKFLEAAE